MSMSMSNDSDVPEIPEPVLENQHEEAPSGATPPQTQMEEVFDRLGPDAGVLAKITSHHGITPRDPLWSAVQTLLDVRDERTGAEAAAGRAADAAARIEAATHGVGETIFNQTVRAGDDLKNLISAGIEEKTVEAGQALVAAIAHAAGQGAADLKKAAADLPKLVAKKKEETLTDWQASLASTAAQEAASRARKGEWWVMGAAVAFGLVMAAIGIWVGYRLAPKDWPAASPPALVARFKGETEFQWENTNAFTPGACPQGRVCVVLKK